MRSTKIAGCKRKTLSITHTTISINLCSNFVLVLKSEKLLEQIERTLNLTFEQCNERANRWTDDSLDNVRYFIRKSVLKFWFWMDAILFRWCYLSSSCRACCNKRLRSKVIIVELACRNAHNSVDRTLHWLRCNCLFKTCRYIGEFVSKSKYRRFHQWNRVVFNASVSFNHAILWKCSGNEYWFFCSLKQ